MTWNKVNVTDKNFESQIYSRLFLFQISVDVSINLKKQTENDSFWTKVC